MKPLVSIVIPVYNAEEYLPQTFAAIHALTIESWELVLVDDGSTDGSAQLCIDERDRYPDKVQFIQQQNRGQASARNRGLEACQGEWVYFCDADDCLRPDCLEILLRPILQNAECDISGGLYIHSQPQVWAEPAEFKFYTSEKAIEKALYQQRPFSGSACGKLYRASLFESERFCEGMYFEDMEINPRLYSRARVIAVTPTPVFYYRWHLASFLHTWNDKRADALLSAIKIEEFTVRKFPRLAPAAQSRRFSATFNICILGAKHGQEELSHQCFEYIKASRMGIVLNPKVRLKNKIGALLSFAGYKATVAVGKKLYR